MAIFEIKNLTFSYPECEKNAIDNLSLTVESGEFMIICGPSGCGKSTLLRQMKTILSPHGNKTGEIIFCGKNLDLVDTRTQASKIGFVSQSPDNQIVTDKVWHELAFGLESLGYDNKTIRGRVAEMAAFFGIENWFYKNTSQLSGGQKQLLNLASIMVMQPAVLILDEPTSQLDPIAASEFLSTLAKINRELGVTVILTEHRLEEAFPLANRLIAMEKGKVICSGTPNEVGTLLKERNSSMFYAMPAPMRIWSKINPHSPCPITVAEGRNWLKKYAKSQPVTEYKPKEKIKIQDEVVISVNDAWFKYEKEMPDVIKSLDLSVKKGEFLAILGGNGTGKTTMLKLLSGIKKPYRGEITVNKSVGLLPQNPQTMFVKKTVYEDLLEILKGKNIKKEEKRERILNISELCRLSALLERHPYDLSGGEQQRAALAKVLLLQPEILLMDEPTKGFDGEFKIEFAQILNSLQKQGVTILMVSHDVEFCASYANRCGLFFDGNIVTQGSAQKFFSGNSFYTTAANRMARDILPLAVTVEDVVFAFGYGKEQDTDNTEVKKPYLIKENIKETKTEKKLPLWRKLIAGVSGLISVIIFFYATSITDLTKLVNSGGMTKSGTEQLYLYLVMILSLTICGISSYRRSVPSINIQTPKEKTKLAKRTVVASVLVLLLIPVTIYAGIYYLGNKQYYITALAVLVECMLPFFLIFEGRKPQARELVIIATLCAMGIAGRAAFFMLPQFKPVAALVIISGIAFGGETGFLVGAVTMLTSNILFSQGPWTPFQMFAMGFIGFLAGVLFKKGILRRTRVSMCIFGALSVIVLYGGIMNPASALIWGSEALNLKMIMAYYLTGFPMDLIHAFATVIFLWFGAVPMLEKLDRIKVKYGLIE